MVQKKHYPQILVIFVVFSDKIYSAITFPAVDLSAQSVDFIFQSLESWNRISGETIRVKGMRKVTQISNFKQYRGLIFEKLVTTQWSFLKPMERNY